MQALTLLASTLSSGPGAAIGAGKMKVIREGLYAPACHAATKAGSCLSYHDDSNHELKMIANDFPYMLVDKLSSYQNGDLLDQIPGIQTWIEEDLLRIRRYKRLALRF